MAYHTLDYYFKDISENGIRPKTLVGRIPSFKRAQQLIDAIHKSGRDGDGYPEHIQSFTVTFRNSFMRSLDYDPNKLKNYFFNYMIQNAYRGVYNEYIYVIEYGKNNRLHIHGLIANSPKKTSKEKWFVLQGVFNERFGRSEISRVRYPDSYLKYLQKEEQNHDFKSAVHFYTDRDDEFDNETETDKETDN